MFRAATALGPFVRRWRLSINPEDIDEMAYAVLRYARSGEDPEEIVAAVERQIDEHAARIDRMAAAMQAHLDAKRAAGK